MKSKFQLNSESFKFHRHKFSLFLFGISNHVPYIYFFQIPESHDKKHWWEYMDSNTTIEKIKGMC